MFDYSGIQKKAVNSGFLAPLDAQSCNRAMTGKNIKIF